MTHDQTDFQSLIKLGEYLKYDKEASDEKN